MNAATMRWSGNSSDMGRGQGTCRTAVSILVTFIGLSYFGPNTSMPTRPALAEAQLVTRLLPPHTDRPHDRRIGMSLRLGRRRDDARSFAPSRLRVGRA